MNNEINFINAAHMNNYFDLINRVQSNNKEELELILKLLSIEDVYPVTKEYVDNLGIDFKRLSNDSRINHSGKFICELAYSLFSRIFNIKSIEATRKLDSDTRNFIINVLYMYNPI